MSDTLVTVATYSMPAEAHILRGRLEDEGVRAYITDEETVAVAWHLAQAIGGIKVQVAPEDAEGARAIIAREPTLQEIEEETGSEVDVRGSTARRALLASFLGLLFPPLQLYSLWLVCSLLFSRDGLSGVRGRTVLALLLNIWVYAYAIYLVQKTMS